MLDLLLQNWIVFNIFSSLCVGFFGFFNKISVEKKHDKNLTLLFLYINQIIISGILVFIWGDFIFDTKIFLLATISALFLITVYKSRFAALKSLDSSVYFTNFRVISSTALFFIGFFIFKDILSYKEIIGFFIGVGIFLLLFEKQKIQNKGYKKSLVFLFVSILFIILYGIIIKIISMNETNFLIFLLYQSISAFIITLFLNRKKLLNNSIFKQGKIKEIFALAVLQAILQRLSLPAFLYALYLGADLGIAYKIQSYSIFVPIILSIIIYKEKLTKKKILAFILTIISLWFFV